MPRATLLLAHGVEVLAAQLEQLEPQLATDPDARREYRETLHALAVALTAVREISPAQDELLTTRQLAERMHVTPKTIRSLAKRGVLKPVRLAARGPAALRWSAAGAAGVKP